MLIEFAREAFYIFNESAIYILAGFFIAGLLKAAIPADKVFKYLGKKKTSSVLWASFLGIPIPLCSCAVLPTAMALRKQGASKGATLSFLISTPETGIDSISITYALIDPIMTIFRPISALITAVTAGMIANLVDTNKPSAVHFTAQENHCACESKCCSDENNKEHPGGKIRELFHYAFVELLDDIMGWLIIGIIIASFISVILPDGFFENYLGSDFLSMLIMLFVGIPIYMCAASSTPIAAALILKGLNPGAALVFLLAGPATNIGTIAAVGKFLGKKMMVVYLGTIIIASIGMGFILNNIYSSMNIVPSAIIGKSSEVIPSFIKVIGSICLMLLMLNNLRKTGFDNALKSFKGMLSEFTGFR